MNIKKLFPEKKLSKKGISEFLDKKGFYIILILCIAIVGVTAVFLSTGGITSPNSAGIDVPKVVPDASDDNLAIKTHEKVTAESSVSTNDKTAGSKVTVNTAANATAATNNTIVQSTDKAAAQPKETIAAAPSKKSGTDKSTTSSSKTSFIMPVFGQISFEYAQDKLVYSKTLEEWRTHPGVDIATERGTPVKAVADGVISDIKSDPMYGLTVIVDHKNGVKTVYANMADDAIVTPNQLVKQNEVIGSVGNSAAFESSEQPHLHFEVWKSNQPVDPTAYLPKK